MNGAIAYSIDVLSAKGAGSLTKALSSIMGGRPASLNLGGRKFFFRPYTMDVVAMAEDFLLKQYRIPDGLSVSTAVDIGAHIGTTSVALSRRFGADVHAIEPDPENFSILQRNALHWGIKPYNLAIGSESGYCSVAGTDGVFRHMSDGQDIRLMTLEEFMRHAGIKSMELLKIDTEGNEIPILKSSLHLISDISIILLELHSRHDRREAFEILSEEFRPVFSSDNGVTTIMTWINRR